MIMTSSHPDPIRRPPSEQLCDLHVYLLPRESWNEKYRSSYNESIAEALSAGFVRVWPELTLYDLRSVVGEDLGYDVLPLDFVFLKSVGRCMTEVKPKQEVEIKCKAFLPPAAWAPEIVVLGPPSNSPGNRAYPTNSDYSPRHNATQPVNGAPTHFPQLSNHDRTEPLDGRDRQGQTISVGSGAKTQEAKAQGKNSVGKGQETQGLTGDLKDKAVRGKNPPGKKNPRAPTLRATTKEKNSAVMTSTPKKVLGTRKGPASKFAAARGKPSKAGEERAKKLKQMQASWTKEAKDGKGSSQKDKGGYRQGDRHGGGGISLKKEEGKVSKTTGKVATAGGVDRGKRVQDPSGSHGRQTRVIEVQPAKPDRAAKVHQWTGNTSNYLIGQLPLVQQQTQKEDPLRRIQGVPGKSGRPDAYTNNTNEDSGIAEPTPEEYDPEFERRQSGAENQYYTGEGNFLQNQQRNKQLEEEAQRYEEERKKEEQRQREEEERQEAIQREERRRIEEEKKEEERREEEKRMEEKRREAERRVEEERREELRKREEENRRKQFEEERRKEEARIKAEKKREEEEKARRLEEQRMEEERREEEEERLRQEEIERSFEEQRQRKVAERIRAEKERAKAMLYDEDDVAMETDPAEDYGGTAPNDTQMRKRAEDELRDYQPQSSWGYKPSGRGGSVAREDADFEVKSQEEVRDGLKRVHLTPELERRAKVGKVQNRSISEDIYETDPAMAQLIAELEAARQERQDKEKEREALIKKAKNLQAKTHDRRYKSYDEPGPWSNSVSPDKDAQPRDYWKKRYFDEKKMTAPLEDQVNRLRNQAEVLHRKLLNHLEGKKGKGVPKVKGPPSKKNDHKITILKMQHELEELRRQAENAKMKLTSEVKLRNQAETEVRSLKSEVTQRKINLTLTRNQKLAALKGGDKLLAKTPIPSVGQGSTSVSAKR
ncbi:uncharacterized protein [Diadema setosum]|uniref:uncharacterized protein isoform X1 n=1 Tax=Diadema setosum TaxID=31175 RepID=UPI003B3A891B